MIELLHACSLILYAALMGIGHCLCLVRKPGRFTSVAIHTILERTSGFAIGWSILAVAGFVYARHGSGGRDVSELLGMLLAAAMVATELWTRSALAAEVRDAAARAEAGGRDHEISRLDDEGCWQMLGRERDDAFAVESARRGLVAWSLVALAALGLYTVALASMVGAGEMGWAVGFLILAFWISIGTLATDLLFDVWPPASDPARVRTCAIYYVHIFEHWINFGVLAGLLGVGLGAPWLHARGAAPIASLAFSAWFAGCLVFAGFVNLVLRPAGLVRQRLPLPVFENAYAAERPTWAWFLCGIHLVMALALVVGLAALHLDVG